METTHRSLNDIRKLLYDFKIRKTEEEKRRLEILEMQNKERELERESWIDKMIRFRDQVISAKVRRASISDYKNWLYGYLLNEGEPSHYYDCDFTCRFHVATSDFEMMPLGGALSMEIIVPDHIQFLGGELGHCHLYLMHNFTVLGGRFVPIYRDISF